MNTPDFFLEPMMTEQDSTYLVRQRIENLREVVGASVDEILELQSLEHQYRQELLDIEAMPKNLGVTSRIQHFIAAIEGKRVNRKDYDIYDGGEIPEEYSNLNEVFIELLKECWLNPKSVKVLSPDKKQIFWKGKRKSVSIYDVFQKEFISEVYFRCVNLSQSPLYGAIQDFLAESFELPHEISLKFTDKTACFIIPLTQFSDFPKRYHNVENRVGYIQVSFVLPKYAQERRRFFKKGGNIGEFQQFLSDCGTNLPDNWQNFLDKLSEQGSLRLYREALVLEKETEISGYFLNVKRGYKNGQWFSKTFIENIIRKRLKKEEGIITRSVLLPFTQYPEWMRKVGGIVIEKISNK